MLPTMEVGIRHVVLVTTFVGNFLSLGMSYALPAVYYSYWLDEFKMEVVRTALVASTNLGIIGFMGKIIPSFFLFSSKLNTESQTC